MDRAGRTGPEGTCREMVITKEFIFSHTTPKGAWTRTQLAAIGVKWPPPRGWIDRAVGREITEAQRGVFVQESAFAQGGKLFP